MIEVIKQGNARFTMECDKCGCEFTYNLSDLNCFDNINCPCCGKSLHHIGYKKNKKADSGDEFFKTIKAIQETGKADFSKASIPTYKILE